MHGRGCRLFSRRGQRRGSFGPRETEEGRVEFKAPVDEGWRTVNREDGGASKVQVAMAGQCQGQSALTERPWITPPYGNRSGRSALYAGRVEPAGPVTAEHYPSITMLRPPWGAKRPGSISGFWATSASGTERAQVSTGPVGWGGQPDILHFTHFYARSSSPCWLLPTTYWTRLVE
jgi:hypothetical protein